MLVFVFVDLIYTSESRAGIDRWLVYLQAESLKNRCVILFVCVLACVHSFLYFNVTSPDTAPVPPIVLCFPRLSFKLKARTKVEDTVAACVHAFASVCVHYAWVERLREGGGVVGNRSILQMLQGRRSEWKVLWLSVVQHFSDSQRYATCGSIPIRS